MQDTTLDLVRANIQKNMGASGIIIEGYPRTMDQVHEYHKFVSSSGVINQTNGLIIWSFI